MIGETAGVAAVPGEGGAEVEAELTNQQRIDQLVGLGYVDESDGGELAAELFEWLAAKFGSDHWKLDDKRRAKIGRPLAAIINSCAQAAFDNLPAGVGDTVSEHPEWSAFGIAVAGTVIPRGLKQLKLKRAKKKAEEGEVIPPKKATVTGAGDFGVPVATTLRG